MTHTKDQAITKTLPSPPSNSKTGSKNKQQQLQISLEIITNNTPNNNNKIKRPMSITNKLHNNNQQLSKIKIQLIRITRQIIRKRWQI